VLKGYTSPAAVQEIFDERFGHPDTSSPDNLRRIPA
jgi:hypothetical protein